jgi:hypothetical protein
MQKDGAVKNIVLLWRIKNESLAIFLKECVYVAHSGQDSHDLEPRSIGR